MSRYSKLLFFITFISIAACAQEAKPKDTRVKQPIHKTNSNFSIKDFLTENQDLEFKTDSIFNSLNENERVAQLIMPAAGKYGKSHETINGLIKDGLIGGILMLSGTVDEFTKWIKGYNKLNLTNGNLPFLYSADAEPSLVNRKIMGSTPVKKANEIESIEEVESVTQKISTDLNKIGINYNFSPVVDMSPNSTV